MDLQTLLFQIYFAFVSAYLSVVLARSLHQNGRVLKRIDENIELTREGIELTREEFKKMDERAELRHREVMQMMNEGFKKMDEHAELRHREVIQMSEQRHREVIQLIAAIKKTG